MSIRQPVQPDHARQALLLAAQLEEANHLVEQLRARAASLNVEVRTRDAVIADLRTQLAAAEKAPEQGKPAARGTATKKTTSRGPRA